MFYLVAVLGISVLIVIHELGHFLVARACGMRVIKFSVGFGPALLRYQFGDTLFQLAAVPLGGYVQIDGLGPQEGEEPKPQKSSVVLPGATEPELEADTQASTGKLGNDSFAFRDKPVWQRILVIAAGPVANLVLAVVIIASAAMTVGAFDRVTTTIAEVVDNSAAERAGLQAGDEILRIDGERLDTWEEVVARIQPSANKRLSFTVARGGEEVTLTVIPALVGGGAQVGIVGQPRMIRLGFSAAVVHGFRGTMALSKRVVTDLSNIASPQVTLTGPVGMVKGMARSAERGPASFASLLAFISVALALFNLLPMPALDGGRLIFLLTETVRGRPVDEKVENVVHALGFLLIIGTVVVVTFKNDLQVFSSDDPVPPPAAVAEDTAPAAAEDTEAAPPAATGIDPSSPSPPEKTDDSADTPSPPAPPP